MTNSLLKAELRLRARASKYPKSLAARLLPDAVGPIAQRIAYELPDESDQKLADWLKALEEAEPEHFRAYTYPARGDLTELSAIERLAIANGDPPPVLNRKVRP
jgi:hypothetical protein